MVANLQAQGDAVALDLAAVDRVSAYFAALARAEGLATGVPQEYDARYFAHQLPGGMLGTMRRQLRELRQEQRLPEVFAEVERVRAELGYPIMVTPLSQVVATMAVMNVLAPQRYATVPDEVIRYVLGRFGTPIAPVDANVRDRILALPRARELAAQPPMPGLDELRRRFAPGLADEEFLLRAVMPAEQVDAMRAAGPCRRGYSPDAAALEQLLQALGKRRDLDWLRIERDGLRLELARRRDPAAAR